MPAYLHTNIIVWPININIDLVFRYTRTLIFSQTNLQNVYTHMLDVL